MNELQFSVVIVAYNNWWLTRRCLLAFDALRGSRELSFETIVIDNASSDETEEEIQEFSWVRYVRNPVNTNFAGGANQGAKLAQAPILLFVNNDAVPIGDAVAQLVRAMDDKHVAIAGGCMLFEDGPVQSADVVVLPEGGWWISYRNLPSDLPQIRRSRDVIGVAGAAMAVDKAWFESVGGFDEGYINGSEDIDLFMRARESGRTLRYVAESRFSHYEGASPKRYDNDERNAKRFFRRWHGQMAHLPRVERGDIGAIAIDECAAAAQDTALTHALDDLITGLRSFGHPIVRGKIKPWSLLDKRFRESVTLAWFCNETRAQMRKPAVFINAGDGFPSMRTLGVEEVGVPWLPCASPDAGERSAIFSDGESDEGVVAIIGDSSVPRLRASGAALGMTLVSHDALDVTSVYLEDIFDIREGRRRVDLVVLRGLTDPCAYGNLALAHAGAPVVVLDSPQVRHIYCDDTAFLVKSEPGSDNGEALLEMMRFALERPELRRKTAERMRADALRRFSPRRAAMRFTDLARVARNGFEKPGVRKKDSPVALD